MLLNEAYHPIEKELAEVEQVLRASVKRTSNNSIREINNYLFSSGGKKLRPALVLLSAKATNQSPALRHQLTKIAAAVELIHMASLVHDDVIDHSHLRHNKSTINSKWGDEVSITMGDYLYSVAFELVSECGNSDIIRCISSATRAMCEGEFLQVCERDNLDLLKERYMIIIKKKTAALFAASCQSGVIISNCKSNIQGALKQYGLNFGIAFQIIDDYLDLVGAEQSLGKSPGQDVAVGEITLPILNLWESVSHKERRELRTLFTSKIDKEVLRRIKNRLLDSGAVDKTREDALSFINLAKKEIDILSNSTYKESLFNLADFILERGFNDGN